MTPIRCYTDCYIVARSSVPCQALDLSAVRRHHRLSTAACPARPL
ncbi:MAG: hypothetical protein ACJ74O_13335 [Frankiaceae bacterium]